LTTDNKKTTKEIEDAIQYAEQHNWRIETGGGHA